MVGVITNSGMGILGERFVDVSPTSPVISRFKVSTGTTPPSIGDTDVGNPGAAFSKTFEPGYPTFDSVNKEISYRCTLLTTEDNGMLISEFGAFNSTPTMWCHDVFTAFSKSNTQIINFVGKDDLVNS